MTEGTVYLVGAGPGDPGLVTVRGAELLERAEVVVTDRLVHPEILAIARGAEVLDVGKRPGHAKATQSEINEILVREARAGRVVVRLKGGDPFVFGRGGEECEALREAGVHFEVVPGITSAVAAPAYAGIPLTHRGRASWAAIATGHEDPAKDTSALDWGALARAGTAVFLMGMRRLPDIIRELMAAGRDPATPAAVIERGTWPSQRIVRETLAGVADAAHAAGLSAPAVLVVGDVAGMSLDWFASRPLAGKRVFVTRTRAQASALAKRLRELGAEPLTFPSIRIVPPQDIGPLDEALVRLGDHDWMVLTSANTVDVIADRLDVLGLDARALAGVKVAAIGPATAERLGGIGIRPDLVPDTYTSVAVAGAMPQGPGRILVPRAAEAPQDMPEALRKRGWEVDVLAAYRTEPDSRSVEGGRAALEDGVDAVLFTASSTVRNFVDLWGPPPEEALVCCIGPVTAETATGLGLRVDAVAAEHTIPGLVEALVEVFEDA